MNTMTKLNVVTGVPLSASGQNSATLTEVSVSQTWDEVKCMDQCDVYNNHIMCLLFLRLNTVGGSTTMCEAVKRARKSQEMRPLKQKHR